VEEKCLISKLRSQINTPPAARSHASNLEVNLEVTNQIPVDNGNPHQGVNVEVANQRPYCQPLFVGRSAPPNHFARVTLLVMVKI
jgi:hypothetical protein